jgi:RNA polymerase sigma factor (sigma-70 family)
MATIEEFADSAALYEACGSSEPPQQAAAYHVLWRYLYRVASYMTRGQPDGEALAQDCAQRALVRVHQQYRSCREPAAFHGWSRRIVSNFVLDELRRRQRLEPLVEGMASHSPGRSIEQGVTESITAVSLRQLLEQAPISDRSRRVVIGRFLDDLDDHSLAEMESRLAVTSVLPSHVQVTRAKNINKLRHWSPLLHFLKAAA